MFDEKIVVPSKKQSKIAMIWLHGLGADGKDLEPLAKMFANLFSESCHILPSACVRPVSLFASQKTRAWYDIPSQNFISHQDQRGIESSAKAIHSLINDEIEKGILSKNIFLFGFSQGAAMALYSALSYPLSLGGVIACSGYLPLMENFDEYVHEKNKKININLSAGTNDTILPEPLSRISFEFLKNTNFNVSYKTYEMEHSISDEQLEDICHWLKSISLDLKL